MNSTQIYLCEFDKHLIHNLLPQQTVDLSAYFFLQNIPMAVLYGVFLYMGVTSLQGVQVGSNPDTTPLVSLHMFLAWCTTKYTPPRCCNPTQVV